MQWTKIYSGGFPTDGPRTSSLNAKMCETFVPSRYFVTAGQAVLSCELETVTSDPSIQLLLPLFPAFLPQPPRLFLSLKLPQHRLHVMKMCSLRPHWHLFQLLHR